jgi:branched-chain amino acid aminotransferase
MQNPLPPLDQREGIIWHNGNFLPIKDAKVHVLTQSLHYSSSVYEGCRIYNGKIFRLEEHMDRLLCSAEILKLKIQYSARDLVQIANEVVSRNNLLTGYVRPLIWRGSKSLKMAALDNSTEVMIAAWETNNGHFYSQKPLELLVSRWVKPELNVMPAQCKSAGHYNMSMVAKYEAMEEGFNDALIMDPHGYISECVTSNIFFVKDNILYTPKPTYALDGITRQEVIKIAQKAGIEVIVADLRLSDLQSFDEAFITGTAAEIQSVGAICYNNPDMVKVSFSKQEVSKQMLELYKSLVGF